MRWTFIIACLLVAVGALLMLAARRDRLPVGQSGIAYVEGEDGQKVLATESRAPVRPADPLQQPNPHGQALPAASAKAESSIEQDPEGRNLEWLTRFQLTERSGKRLGSEDLKGQPYLASFFFTSCPSVCPKQNEKLKQLQDKFRDQPIRFVSISCDPEVDRPEVLAQYAQRFDADEDQWLFFTGDMNYIRRVGAEFFGLGIVRYGHPEKFALMDAQGKTVGLYTWTDPGQWLTLQSDISKLIASDGMMPPSTDSP